MLALGVWSGFAAVGCGEKGSTSAGATAAPEPPVLISEASRLLIWNAEHQSNVVKSKGMSRLAEAVKAGEAERIAAMFGDEVAASLPDAAPTTAGTGGLQVERRQAARGEGKTVTKDQLVDWLMAQRKAMPEGELKVTPHVIRLSGERPSDLAGRWSGSGKLELFGTGADGSRAEGIVQFDFACRSGSEEVLAGEGWIDQFHVTSASTGRSEAPLMKDVAAESGIHVQHMWDNWNQPRDRRVIQTGGLYLADVNRDGRHDVFVTDSRFSVLYLGQADGRFRESTAAFGIRGELGGGVAAFVDIDGDGWDDLIHIITHHPDAYRVYRNRGGTSFEDVTRQSNLPSLLLGMTREAFAASRKNVTLDTVQVAPTGISIADYDLDGRLDLYVTRGAAGGFKAGSWIDGRADRRASNQLLRNTGDFNFEDVTKGAPLNGGHRSTTNAVWLHANEDRRPDIYVIDEFGDGGLLVNEPGGFIERSLNPGPTDFGSMGMTTGDFDNDGRADIYVAEMYSKAGERVMANLPDGSYPPEVMQKLRRLVDGSQMYRGLGGSTFKACGRELAVHAVGWAWGASFVDLDNDGWLDLYATAGFISHDRTKPDG